MNKTIIHLFLLILSISIISCKYFSNSKTADLKVPIYAELEKANWLIGKWQNSSPEGVSTEIWEKKNDSIFVGISYFVTGKDTISSEKISLEQKGNKLFYIPIVTDQNNGQPIVFTMTSSTLNSLVFENPIHDFPQIIIYKQITKDSLLAVISGKINGIVNSQNFPMKRIK